MRLGSRAEFCYLFPHHAARSEHSRPRRLCRAGIRPGRRGVAGSVARPSALRLAAARARRARRRTRARLAPVVPRSAYFNTWYLSWHPGAIHRSSAARGCRSRPRSCARSSSATPGTPSTSPTSRGGGPCCARSTRSPAAIVATLDVPWVDTTGPHWDAVAEEFHATVQSGPGGRDVFPRGRNALYVRGENGGSLERLDGLDEAGVGDVALTLAAPLGRALGGEHRARRRRRGARPATRGRCAAAAVGTSGCAGSGTWTMHAQRAHRRARLHPARPRRRASSVSSATTPGTPPSPTASPFGARWQGRVIGRLDELAAVGVHRREARRPGFYLTLGVRRELGAGWIAFDLGENYPLLGVTPDYSFHLSGGFRLPRPAARGGGREPRRRRRDRGCRCAATAPPAVPATRAVVGAVRRAAAPRLAAARARGRPRPRERRVGGHRHARLLQPVVGELAHRDDSPGARSRGRAADAGGAAHPRAATSRRRHPPLRRRGRRHRGAPRARARPRRDAHRQRAVGRGRLAALGRDLRRRSTTRSAGEWAGARSSPTRRPSPTFGVRRKTGRSRRGDSLERSGIGDIVSRSREPSARRGAASTAGSPRSRRRPATRARSPAAAAGTPACAGSPRGVSRAA